MAYLKANDSPIQSGTLALPFMGRGTADVRLAVNVKAAPISALQAVTLSFQDGTRYAMTCLRAGEDKGAWRVLLVQGKGKLSTLLPAKFYQAIPKRNVVSELLSEAGETLGTLDIPGSFSFWTRRKASAYEALEAVLLDEPLPTWYLDMSGAVHVKPVSGEDYSGELVRVGEQLAKGVYTFGGAPDLTPQHSLEGKAISRVVHHIGGGPRTSVWLA